MKTINLSEAINIINSLHNEFFTVQFIKKSTNELRTMNCRKEVKKHLKGGKLKYNPFKYNLLPVYDLIKKDYRIINLETLQVLKVNHNIYKVV